MTDKQIIIDGVPVQDCCYFDYENDGYEDSCYIHQNECSAQNCYYKQLKRKEQELEQVNKAYEACKESRLKVYNKLQEKEQECERLKDIIETRLEDANICDSALNYINDEYIYVKRQFDQLEAENKELKKRISNYKYLMDNNADYCGHLEDYGKLLEQLRAYKIKAEECEVLKTELEQEKALKETYLACYKTKHEELANKYETLKVRCKSLEEISGGLQKQNHELTVENELLEVYRSITPLNVEKLVQTLTEIKEYFIKECEVCKEQYVVDDYICSNCQAYELLQKISEVIENE